MLLSMDLELKLKVMELKRLAIGNRIHSRMDLISLMIPKYLIIKLI